MKYNSREKKLELFSKMERESTDLGEWTQSKTLRYEYRPSHVSQNNSIKQLFHTSFNAKYKRQISQVFIDRNHRMNLQI